MQNKSRADAGRNGDDSAPAPVGDNAKREHPQSGQDSNSESDRNGTIPLGTDLTGGVRPICALPGRFSSPRGAAAIEPSQR
jgi:hypothetical protein